MISGVKPCSRLRSVAACARTLEEISCDVIQPA
ncbi:hypothetical protein RHECNPAF_35000104 [Rhizobium etli CNPAF512]|nr:hypothetical protein RHECNPAF_35000104 [Rhizobium etli CNPAF512]